MCILWIHENTYLSVGKSTTKAESVLLQVQLFRRLSDGFEWLKPEVAEETRRKPSLERALDTSKCGGWKIMSASPVFRAATKSAGVSASFLTGCPLSRWERSCLTRWHLLKRSNVEERRGAGVPSGVRRDVQRRGSAGSGVPLRSATPFNPWRPEREPDRYHD